jgi:TetR/AcrR family transcriptional repressor of nem operon
VPRPRGYRQEDAVERARTTFWEEGYERTTIANLERRTGLNRSSLYLAFGTKRALFDTVLDSYEESFIDPLIGIMEGDGAGLADVAAFFARLKAILLEEAEAGLRGCLLINTIGELSGRDPNATDRSAAYRDHLRRAFTHALEGAAARGEGSRASVRRRARMLTATMFGVSLSANIDPSDAADLCDSIISEVTSWATPRPRRRPGG